MAIHKYDLAGQKIYEKIIDTALFYFSNVKSITLSNGNTSLFYTKGLYNVNNEPIYIFHEVDNSGNVIFTTEFSVPNEWSFSEIIEAGNGAFIFLGNYITKYNPTNSVLYWQKYYSITAWSTIYSNILMAPDNNFIVSGYGDDGTASTYQFEICIFKIDPNGDTLTSKKSGTPKQDYCYSTILTHDNGFALIGKSSTNYTWGLSPDYASSVYLIRTDKDCNLLYEKKLAENMSTAGMLISENSDYSFSIVGNKLAYDNPNVIHTIFLRTKTE